MSYRYIAVEGPIGVGKTTLARRLAEALAASLVSDTESSNPYLESFYSQPRQFALHTQLHFLASRLEVLQDPAVLTPTGPLVADFMLEKDRLFAELTLDSHEWWMYSQIHDRVAHDFATPDLVIYLQAPLERLLERIERRGIAHEAHIPSHYLQQVIESYERFFHAWTRTPLLIVNVSDINLADDNDEVAELVARIGHVDRGRHYLNPVAIS